MDGMDGRGQVIIIGATNRSMGLQKMSLTLRTQHDHPGDLVLFAFSAYNSGDNQYLSVLSGMTPH